MSDAQKYKRTKQGGGRAFHSRVEPYVEFIREQRMRRKTWKEIAESLRADKGCAITLQGVYQFYRRHLKLSKHWERQPAVIPLVSPKNTPLASTPPIRPFRAVNPNHINLNDLTKL